MDKEEELCGLVINVLFTVMWRGASQPKERGSVIASINMLGMNSNTKVEIIFEQREIRIFAKCLYGLVFDLKTIGVS